MSKIRILNENEINSIAAGEVIERPSNIIKELIDNSIDAESSNIKIYTEDSGKKSIKIIDDGFGIEKEDLKKTILSHSTSKLTSLNDLAVGTIKTRGFRGEALSSICAISNLEITSRTKKENFANKIYVENGQCSEIIQAPFSNGTSIEIKNIFDCIPVRKKFLKSSETELTSIENILISIGISVPNVRLSFYNNQKLVFDWPSSKNIIERVKSIIGKEKEKYILECYYDDGYTKINGIISSIEYGHYDRSKIFILINNRPIKQYKLTQAIIKGYQADLLPYRFPFAYLSIEVPTKDIDINIHPKKEEVAFLHPKKVENAILESIKKTLQNESKNTFIKAMPNIKEKFNTNEYKKEITNNNLLNNSENINNYEKFEEFFNKKKFTKKQVQNLNFEKLNTKKEIDIDKNTNEDEKLCNNTYSLKEEIKDISTEHSNLFEEKYLFEKSFIGIYSKTYLLFDKEDYLLFIDQHALHEKIIFQKLFNNKIENNIQMLLSPICLLYDSNSCKLAQENKDIFLSCGIILEIYEPETVAIKGMIYECNKVNIRNSINIILNNLKNNKEETENNFKDKILRKIRGDIACKMAIKAGDPITENEINILLENAFKFEESYLCPHGRPTYYKLNKYTIETFFKRK
jgi:DNA mismatch repair protein MutL